MNRIALYIVWIGCCLCCSCSQTRQKADAVQEKTEQQPIDTVQHIYQYGVCMDSLDINEYQIRSGDNPAAILDALGFSAREAERITRVSATVLDPTKLRAGMCYYTFTTQDSVAAIRYMAFAKSLTDYAVIDLSGDSVRAYEFNKPVSIKRHYAEGTITSSLWNVMKEKGADPLLALKLSDVFAWQIDFFDVKEGDSFRVMYDVAYIDDIRLHRTVFLSILIWKETVYGRHF